MTSERDDPFAFFDKKNESTSSLNDDDSEGDISFSASSSESSSEVSVSSFKGFLPDWVKMPITWINEGKLKYFKWTKESGSKNESALIILLVMFHYMDNNNGIVELTYEELSIKTNLSKAMLSSGIDILCSMNLIKKNFGKRSVYKIIEFNSNEKWAKLPSKKMYVNESVKGFGDFKKRNKIELDALKLYFIFISGRDRHENICWISYDKIIEKTGIKRENIKTAISLLCINSLIVVDQKRNEKNFIKNGYRVIGINDYIHSGTSGRALRS